MRQEGGLQEKASSAGEKAGEMIVCANFAQFTTFHQVTLNVFQRRF